MNDEQRDVVLKLLSLFKIEGKTADQVVTEGQLSIFFELIFRPHKRLHIMTSTQFGKQISDDTPILTTKGWTTHGELKIGDKVFAPDGLPIKVLGVSEKSTATLEVEFSNGEKICCHENHEWRVKNNNWRN